jgi:two-component system, OmpR family, phosphate regulon sensor histidine kinase PhoR
MAFRRISHARVTQQAARPEGEFIPTSPSRMSLFVWILALLAAVGFGAEMSVCLWPQNQGLISVGIVFAALFGAVLLRVRIRSEARRLAAAARELPEWNIRSDQLGWSRELADGADELRAASERINRRLTQTHQERLQLEALLDSMQDPVVAVDSAGRIQWTNRAMQALIPDAYSQSAVRIGQALVQTLRDPEVLACVKTALESRTISEKKTTSLAPGRIFEVNASPLQGGGAVAVLHDVTQVEHVERTQRDFVANVSHELRTPLTSISGYVETLLDDEQLSPIAREFLETILKNSSRMSRLTEDLLSLARVESREAKMHPAPIRAEVLVRDAVAAMRGMVQDENASLDIGETTATEVMADQDAMVQVLGNLIENGIKYGRRSGAGPSHVVVSARSVDGPGSFVEFSVRDFGQGIASEHLERIFERFYRVDKARSRDSGGTGLGLAIARRMVESQGGSIRAESDLNSGSTFTVRLPAAEIAS